jgi:hypothetical protein
MREKEVSKEKHNLPIIQCTCGFKLLLLPDAEVMGQAIEKHTLEHKKKYRLTQEEAENLEFQLIAQAFELAAKESKKP